MTINTTPKLFTPEKAIEVAADYSAGELDGWTYEALHDPKGTGYSLVIARDEDGEFVAFVPQDA